MKTIKTFNKYAAMFNLELVKGEGYFYWIGTTDAITDMIFLIESPSVYVHHFSQLNEKQWKNELIEILTKIINNGLL